MRSIAIERELLLPDLTLLTDTDDGVNVDDGANALTVAAKATKREATFMIFRSIVLGCLGGLRRENVNEP